MDRNVETGSRRDAGKVDHSPGRVDPDTPVPSEAGHRASIDRTSGEVHGSGSGAGGGSEGENYDSDPHSGSNAAETGRIDEDDTTVQRSR